MKLKRLFIAAFCLIHLFSLPLPGTDNTDGQSPNIIFILTDDQRWDAMGYAGNPVIKTPNMDQLAREGVYFENAFVTTPICAASRASIATGMYERTHRFTFNTPPLAADFVDITYYKLLKEAGYHTGFIGKFGMQLEAQADKELFDVYDPYMPDFYYRLTGKASGKHRYLTYITGDKAINFIENAPSGQPFCLNISFNAPHAEDKSPEQYIFPDNLADLYKDITVPPPQLSEDRYYNEQPEFVREGLNRIRWYWRFDTPEKYQRMIKGYYRMITAVDEVLGQIRSTLKSNGLDKNTLIIFTSDNGYFLGERGFAGKWLMYENSVRVPMIIYDPNNEYQPRHVKHLALNIDIAPTILNYAGIEKPVLMQGESLLPVVKGKQTDWREEFFCEHLFDMPYIPKSEGIRTEKWKYFRYIDHPEHEELYNLNEDDLEINNLAGEIKYSELLLELRMKSDAWIGKLEKTRSYITE